MITAIRLRFVSFLLLVLPSFAFWMPGNAALAAPKVDKYWRVDDIRPGMKGVGRTVMKGTKVETFQAEVLGVLKNTSPGRDMVICRLSGLNLEKTGVIAGMSGSPVYIDNKLLGAVAYAWPYGKEPIAGITPFSQMHGFVEAFERRDADPHQQADARRSATTACHRRQGVRQCDRDPGIRGSETDGGGWLVDDAAAHAAGGDRLHAQQPETAARALRLVRPGADAGRRRPGPRRRRGERYAAGAGQPAGRRSDPRRLRSVRHRHRHPRRGQSRLRLGPSVHEPGLLRVSADVRLHHHRLSAADGELQDGLAAQIGGRHQRRRQHLHRRLAGPQGRHAAGDA